MLYLQHGFMRSDKKLCVLQYNNVVDGTRVVCSNLFWDVKQDIMCSGHNVLEHTILVPSIVLLYCTVQHISQTL